MKSSIVVALLAALPVEMVNCTPSFPIDIGLPENAGWLARFLAGEWVIVHYPALVVSGVLDGSRWWPMLYFSIRYVDTALLFVVCVLIFYGLRRLGRWRA